MRRVLALFQRQEDAWASAEELRATGVPTAVRDAALMEDSQAGRRIGRGLVLGGAIGLAGGVIIGLAALVAGFAAWLPVLVLAVIALSAFGALGGALFGAAAAEQVRSSGESMAVAADVPEERTPEVEAVFREHDAAAVQEVPLRRSRRPRVT